MTNWLDIVEKSIGESFLSEQKLSPANCCPIPGLVLVSSARVVPSKHTHGGRRRASPIGRLRSWISLKMLLWWKPTVFLLIVLNLTGSLTLTPSANSYRCSALRPRLLPMATLRTAATQQQGIDLGSSTGSSA